MAGVGILLGLYPTLISSFCAGCLEQGTRGLWKVWGFSMWFVTIPMVVFQYAGTITDDSVTESHFKSTIYPFYGPAATKIALYFSAILFLFLVYTAKDAKQHQKLGNHLSVLVAQEMSDGIEMLDEREGISKELKFTILISVTLFFTFIATGCVQRNRSHSWKRQRAVGCCTHINQSCVRQLCIYCDSSLHLVEARKRRSHFLFQECDLHHYLPSGSVFSVCYEAASARNDTNSVNQTVIHMNLWPKSTHDHSRKKRNPQTSRRREQEVQIGVNNVIRSTFKTQTKLDSTLKTCFSSFQFSRS